MAAKYEIEVDLNSKTGTFKGIYSYLSYHGLATNGDDTVPQTLTCQTPFTGNNWLRITRAGGFYTGVYKVSVGSYDLQTHAWTNLKLIYSTGDIVNGAPTRIILYCDDSFFGIAWFRNEGERLRYTHIGETTDGDNVAFVAHTNKTLLDETDAGVTFLDDLTDGGNLILEQRQIYRNNQICVAPALVTTQDNAYFGTLKNIDNACVSVSIVGLVELDGYDILRRQRLDVTDTPQHYKNTGLRIELDD